MVDVDVSNNIEDQESNNGASKHDLLRDKYESGEPFNDAEMDFIADTAVDIIRGILIPFGETAASIDEYEGDEGELILDINGGDLAVLIGRHGKTLDSLQTVVSSLLSARLGFHYPVIIDIESYKSRRREKLQGMARAAAERAKRQGSRVALSPMNAYERRIVHLALVNDPEVTTHSEGEDPARRVVITTVNI